MYDVASIAPYTDPIRWKTKPPKLAMSIGGENRAGRVSIDNLCGMTNQCDLERVGITAEGCAGLLQAYAEAIPGKFAEVFDDLECTESAAAARELRTHMEEPIGRLCEKAKAKL